MRDILIYEAIFDPANGQLSNYPDCMSIRLHKDLSNIKSSFTIGKIPNNVLYNRSLDKDTIWENNNDLIVMNSPSIYRDDEALAIEKAGRPYLLSKNSLMIIGALKKEDIADMDTDEVVSFFGKLVCEIIGKYGDENKIKMIKNDLYYNGKKFGGVEATCNGNVTIGASITCKYLPERVIIDSLPNKGNYGITGILEEIPDLTEDILIQELLDGVNKFFN